MGGGLDGGLLPRDDRLWARKVGGGCWMLAAGSKVRQQHLT